MDFSEGVGDRYVVPVEATIVLNKASGDNIFTMDLIGNRINPSDVKYDRAVPKNESAEHPVEGWSLIGTASRHDNSKDVVRVTFLSNPVACRVLRFHPLRR